MPSHQERRSPLPKDYQFGDAWAPSEASECVCGFRARLTGEGSLWHCEHCDIFWPVSVASVDTNRDHGDEHGS